VCRRVGVPYSPFFCDNLLEAHGTQGGIPEHTGSPQCIGSAGPSESCGANTTHAYCGGRWVWKPEAPRCEGCTHLTGVRVGERARSRIPLARWIIDEIGARGSLRMAAPRH